MPMKAPMAQVRHVAEGVAKADYAGRLKHGQLLGGIGFRVSG